MKLTHAIARRPAGNFRDGLTTANLGAPDYAKAIAQHEAYCAALERCGLEVMLLEPDPRFPDSTFVEDCAVLTKQLAILARPGVESRAGEVDAVAKGLGNFYSSFANIQDPGTLDGGDVCEAGNQYFIGISERTNEAGAGQLSSILESLGHSSTFVNIQGISKILHLKSGLAYLGDKRLVVIDALAGRDEFVGYEVVAVSNDEAYAANSVRVNDHILIAQGYPTFASTLAGLGYKTIQLEMTEFQKMDGGLSCLSLRF